MVFVAFVACGWTRVSLARFTAASLIISALYLPLMLYLVIVFGDAFDDHLGLWTWPLLLVAVSASSFVRKRVFAFRETNDAEVGGRRDAAGGLLRHAAAGARRSQGRHGRAHTAAAVLRTAGVELVTSWAALSAR